MTTFTIKTTDGVVVRKSATRAYKAAWVGRNENNEVISHLHRDFTINPKFPIGTKKSGYILINDEVRSFKWTYESLVADEVATQEK